MQTRAADPGLRHEVTEVLDAMRSADLTVLRTWAFCAPLPPLSAPPYVSPCTLCHLQSMPSMGSAASGRPGCWGRTTEACPSRRSQVPARLRLQALHSVC